MDNNQNLAAKYSINEQHAYTADDPKERIQQYLDDDDFLTKLSVVFRDLEDDSTATLTELQISGKEFGVAEEDIIHVKVDKSDKNNPKFTMWIVNEEFMFDDVDLEVAAKLIYRAGDGVGTDADSLIGVGAAIGQIANDKGVDPNEYFKRISKIFDEQYKESLESFIEGEFTGAAEAAALNMFRQPISASWKRGINLTGILTDLGITLATFGWGTAARWASKSVSAGARTLTHASKAAEGAQAAVKIADTTNKLKKAFSGMSIALQVSRFKRAFPIGSKVDIITKGGKAGKDIMSVSVTKFSGTGAKTMVHFNKHTPTLLTNLVASDLSVNMLARLVPNTATRIAVAAGVTAGGISTNPQSEGESIKDASGNAAETGGEILGWYDTLASDPKNYLSEVAASNASKLADMIWDLSKGSGWFGTETTNQEELAISLIITSLSPEVAEDVEKFFTKQDTKGRSIMEVIDEELGGDLAKITKYWWAGCTRDTGIEGQRIAKIKEQLSK